MEPLTMQVLQEYRTWKDPSRGGMQVALGTYPCTFRSDLPHPMPSVSSRRLARFRRHLEAGIRYYEKRGWSIHYVVVAMRYDRNGKLPVSLRYATQRFLQRIRRRGLSVEYLRVVEPTGKGVVNHSNLVLAVNGVLPSKAVLKADWAHSTYGTSYEIESQPVNDVGSMSRYLSKFLGGYLSKTFPGGSEATGGLDRSDQIATGNRVSSYVSTSRGWLPEGAERRWKALFMECAVIWTCNRGYFHTDLRDTGTRWYDWLLVQPRRKHVPTSAATFLPGSLQAAAGSVPYPARARAPERPRETGRGSGGAGLSDVAVRSEDVKTPWVGGEKLTNG